MTDLDWALIHGRAAPPVAPRRLAAGNVSAALDGPDLVAVGCDGLELVRRIGVRVRDPAWGTVPPVISGLDVDDRSAHFAAEHRDGDIAFTWRGAIAVEEGAVTYEMDGRAEAAFPYARIGLVILHPPAVTAGRPFRARGPDGEAGGMLPELVGPQLIVDGEIQPLFPGFRELELDVAGGLTLALALEGDVFEMEDQRNWIDGSFKTYSTPVGLPIPHYAEGGRRFRQRVRIEVRGRASGRPRPAGPAVRIGPALARTMPALGVGRLDDARALGCAHLRIELGPGDVPAPLPTGPPLELALHLPADEAAAVRILDGVAAAAPPPARVLVHRAGEGVTTAATAALAARRLPGVPVAGGSEADFAGLNREPPPVDALLDALCYGANPQVHDTDDRSVMQALQGLLATIRSAVALPGARPVHVTPITLRPRGADPDPRRAALFAASWTAGAAAAIAIGGAASATFLDVAGPARHVVRELCAWRGRPLADMTLGDADRVTALAVREGAALRALVANLTAENVVVEVTGLDAAARVAYLDAATAREPDPFAAGERTDGPLRLGPYGVARLAS